MNTMTTKDLIEEFFTEQFNNTSPFFLYKDKQMLNNGEFKEYAQRQISKAKKASGLLPGRYSFAPFIALPNSSNMGPNPIGLILAWE